MSVDPLSIEAIRLIALDLSAVEDSELSKLGQLVAAMSSVIAEFHEHDQLRTRKLELRLAVVDAQLRQILDLLTPDEPEEGHDPGAEQPAGRDHRPPAPGA